MSTITAFFGSFGSSSPYALPTSFSYCPTPGKVWPPKVGDSFATIVSFVIRASAADAATSNRAAARAILMRIVADFTTAIGQRRRASGYRYAIVRRIQAASMSANPRTRRPALGSPEPGARRVNTAGQVLFASLIGTTIEFFDFYIYATAAVLVFPRLFFPSTDPASGVLASLATFAIAFVARPIGSALFGHFGD